VKDASEPGFDCGNKTLAEKGVLCADYCPTVCHFTFHSNNDCSPGDEYAFSIYGAPKGSFYGNYHYETWLKQNNFPKNTNTKWKSVHVNMNGCTLDIFADINCEDGEQDQFVSTFTGNTEDMGNKTFMNTKGNCSKLEHPAYCVKATRPCLAPEYNFTTTFMTDGGAIKHNDETHTTTPR